MLYTDHPPSTGPSASSRLFWRTTLGAVLAVAVLAITAAASPRDAGGSIDNGLTTAKAAVAVVDAADPPSDGLDPAGFDAAIDAATVDADQAAREKAELEAEVAAWLDAEAVAHAQAEAAARVEAERATSRYSGSSGPSAAQWAALRACESSGNYGAVSASGAYRGAYQFSQQTWNSIASRNHPWLVGVDPAAASPADQDAQARALYAASGPGQWPNCGRHL
jgi:hypothetical protein